MTTAIAQKTPVEIKWPVNKIEEEATRVIAVHFLSAFQTLSKYGPEALKEYDDLILKARIDYYKKLGVKSPIDLVKLMSEFEANVFGSKIQIWGDESKASLTYEACGMWNTMQKLEKMTPEMEEKMGAHFENCVKEIAKAFGFKGEVKFEEPCATVTFWR